MQKEYNVITCGKGWECLYRPIVEDVISHDMKKASVENKIGIYEVQEKFGRLDIRLYNINNAPETLLKRIWDAENKSEETCEFCGTHENVGHTYATTWKKTCCHSCYENKIRMKMPLSQWKKGRD